VETNIYWSPRKVPVHWFPRKVPVILVKVLKKKKKFQFSRDIFEKYSNTQFHEYPSSVIRDAPCGRTDRHDEANSCYSQVSQSAKKKNGSLLATDLRHFNFSTVHLSSSLSLSLSLSKNLLITCFPFPLPPPG